MSSANWADLRPRVLSALVMIAVGVGAIWAGGLVFQALIVVVCGLMGWELARMTGTTGSLPAVLIGLVAAAAMAAALWLSQGPRLMTSLALPLALPLILLIGPRRDRLVTALYSLAISYGCLAFLILSDGDRGPILWLLAIVITSDVAGYFAGRMIGGPKFWPRISPKKTWSGTIAGWIGAALLGLLFLNWHDLPLAVLFAPLLAFAGQMGDIAESAIKRRAGVKDSSALIPGHGGVLDRFDALLFAAPLMLVMVVGVMASEMPDPAVAAPDATVAP